MLLVRWLLTWVNEDRVISINWWQGFCCHSSIWFTKGLFLFLVRLKGGCACNNQASLWSVGGDRQAGPVLPTIQLNGRIYSGATVKCFLYFILVPAWSTLSSHSPAPPLLWTVLWVESYLQLRSLSLIPVSQ